MRFLIIAFVLIPIIEMTILIKVGGMIGAPATIGLVLLTAVIGLALLKRQGISTLMRAQQKADSGEIPLQEMAEGIFLAVGGALLLTPGFFTDVIGFCCLIPGVRQVFLLNLLKAANFKFQVYGAQASAQETENSTIDGEFYRERDHDTIDSDKKP